MSPRFADRMDHMTGSATGRAATDTSAPITLDLGVGSPDWSPPAAAIEAAIDAARAALTGPLSYGPPGGDPELRQRVLEESRWHASTSGLDSVLTCGGKEALFLGLGAVLTPGDRVVLCAPYWPSFPEQVRAWGGVPVIVPPDEEMLPDSNQQREALRGAKAIIINSPGNPSGRLWSRERFQDLARQTAASDTWVVLDAVYGGLCKPGANPLPGGLPPDLAARTLVVDSASKQYALPGLRIGWATGPTRWIEAVRRLQDAATTHPSLVAQAALRASLAADPKWRPAIQQQLEERRETIRTSFRASSRLKLVPPDAGLYAMLQLRGLQPDDEDVSDSLTTNLRHDHGLRVLSGTPFGAPNTLRVALRAAPSALSWAMETMEQAATDLLEQP